MKIWIENDFESMSLKAAQLVAAEIIQKQQIVLGLATGSTPLGTYQNLIRMVKEGVVSFRDVTTFNLDEYVGVSHDHPNSYHTYMWKNLFSEIDISMDRTHLPNGYADDLEKQCIEYDQLIEQAGGIDIQLLGIGINGHIGFNEPGEELGSLTHVVQLSDNTRLANARFFDSLEEVPKFAVTMGLKSIMNARKLLLLASGEDKSEAVKQAVFGEVNEKLPASILQLHPNCVLVLDQAAASRFPAGQVPSGVTRRR